MRTSIMLSAALGLLAVPGCRKGQKPDVPPTPWGAAVARPGRPYAYWATAKDPDGDDIAVRFDWDDGGTSDWSIFLPPGDTFTLSHTWPRADTCHVRAQARDRRGNVSEWSYVLRVAVTDSASNPPSVPPQPALPDTGWLGITYALRAVGTDPDSDKVSFEFSWGDGTTTISAEASPGETVKATHAWLDSGLSIVCVRAVDTYGARSAWSEPCSFRIRPEGTVKWYLEDVGSQYACPAIAGDGTIYVNSDDALSAVDPQGRILWQSVGHHPTPAALGSDGTIYFGIDLVEAPDALVSLNPDGSTRWQCRVSDRISHPPAIGADGTIYFTHDTDTIFALNPDSTLKWCVDIGDYPRTPPAVAADGAVYVASADSVFCLNPDGTLRWWVEADNPYYAPISVMPDGTILLSLAEHSLVALYGSSPLANSPWPKFQHDLSNSGRAGP